MVLKTIKSVRRASKLLSAIADLYDTPSEYSDTEIHVGPSTFKCHKMILALQSTYFKELLFPGRLQSTVFHYTLDHIVPDDFHNVLRYLYTGEIELESRTVGRVLRLATQVQLDELKDICVQLMVDTLDAQTCVQYWNAAQDVGDSILEQKCLELFLKKFAHVTKTCLQDMIHEMMMAAIERDDLNVNNEVELCDVLLKWFDVNCQGPHSIRPLQLVSLIRWSAVNIEYIKSKMINNETLTKTPECFEFLSKVISYRLTGIQFPGLRTHHRPSTGLESFIVTIGTGTGRYKPISDSHCFSLQSSKDVAIAKLPTEQHYSAVACTNVSSIYVIGAGVDDNETWRWDSTGVWTRCGDLIQGRRRHCATFVNNTSMFALGGRLVASTDATLVEQFSTIKNTWTSVGQLVQCVKSAGCVTYKTSIYLFGGCLLYSDESVDCIQEYDTITQQCTVLTQRLPKPCGALRAVLWDKSVLLMERFICMIFGFEQKTLQLRKQFTPNVGLFGLVLDNQTLFVVGGRETKKVTANGKVRYTCTDDVKCIPVMDIINNQPTVNWTQHSKLKSPTIVSAFSLMTLANT